MLGTLSPFLASKNTHETLQLCFFYAPDSPVFYFPPITSYPLNKALPLQLLHFKANFKRLTIKLTDFFLNIFLYSTSSFLNKFPFFWSISY